MNNLKTKKKLKDDRLVFWTLTFPFAVLVLLVFRFLEVIRVLKIENKDQLPKTGGLIVISNHPSLWEIILIYQLFFRHFFRNPWRYTAYSTPDKGNYYDKFYYRPLRSRFIPVPRNDSDKLKGAERQRLMVTAIQKMASVVNRDGIVILFPEGGRTSSGAQDCLLRSTTGKVIKPFKTGGLERLIEKTEGEILVVWVDGTDKVLPRGKIIPRLWRPVTIKIGPRLATKDVRGISHLESLMLQLADS